MSTETSRGMLWVAIVSLAVGLVAALVTVAVFSGRLDARVTTIEQMSPQRVNRAEWDQFARDVQARLVRIENKLDQRDDQRR